MTVYNDQVSQYITTLFAEEDEALRHARENSLRLGFPAINIKPEEGRFLQLLVRAIGTMKAVEIGTLGGYSGIWLGRGLAPGGKLVTLEKDPYHAEIARQHFELAGLAGLAEIRVGDARQLLQSLPGEGPIDFVFIDAEKPGYDYYFDWAVQYVRPGGVIAAHNAFRKGSVMSLSEKDQYTELMQVFNRKVAAESRLLSTIYPAGDGTLISLKLG